MAKNHRYTNALHISIPVPEGVKSGDLVQVGSINGVAQIDREADGTATVWLDGSWLIEVDGATTVGAPVYITTDGTLSATAADGTPWGVALATKTTGSAPVEVAPLGYHVAAPAGTED